MIKSGIFIHKEVTYQVHEVESKGYYRLDICVKDSQFHLDPLSIIFSMYKRKKTFMYGDRDIYQAFVTLKDKLLFATLEANTEKEWVDGKFVMRRVRGTDQTFFMDKTYHNGKYVSEYYVDGEEVIGLGLVSDLEFNTLPINSDEYMPVEIAGKAALADSPYVPLSVLAAKYDLSWDKEMNYFVVKTIEAARAVLVECIKTKFLVGFDYETDGVDFNLYTRNNIVGVVLSPRRTYSYYIPIGMKKYENIPWDFMHEIAEAFRTIQENSTFTDEDDISKAYEIAHGAVAHYQQFENKVSQAWGLDIPIRHCSYILSYIINPNKFTGTHDLKGLEYERTGRKFLEFDDIFLDKKAINFADLDEELSRVYACPDADNTCGVLEGLWRKLPPFQRALYELEAQLVKVKSEQEYWGIRIDEKVFMESYMIAKEQQNLLLALIQHMLKTEANINSTQVLQEFLYNRMRAPVVLRTNKGKPSTSGKALKKLASLRREDVSQHMEDDIKDSGNRIIIKKDALNQAKFPVILLLEKYREMNKQITAFFNRIIRDSKGDLRRFVDEIENEDGTVEQILGEAEGFQTRYFFWVAQYGAETGRQSSPIHQLPKVIKKGVKADSDDHYLADTDYAQVELRLIFSLAGETKLVELCKDPDNDMHRAIACLLQDKEMWEISAEERQRDKARNFGVVYLISGMGLALQKYGAGATKAEIDECTKSIADFYKGAKRVSAYIKKNREIVIRDKKIATKFNRARYFPELSDPDIPRDRKESLIRQANNVPVQGLAADIMKRAEVNIQIYIKDKGWDKLVATPQGDFPLVRSMLTAHDELLASCHKSIPVEAIMKMKRDCMEIALKDFAPLFVGTSIVDNWVEGKDSTYEVPVSLRNKLIEDFDRTGVSALDMTKSPKVEMLRIVNEFREKNLRKYMEDLISEHGDDPEELAKQVKHASLTHELIDRFPQTKEEIEQGGYLTHLEQILYSTRKYLEYRSQEGVDASALVQAILDEKAKEDAEINFFDEEDEKTSLMEQVSGLQDSLVEFDKQGNIVAMDGDNPYEYDMDSLLFEDEADFLEDITSGDRMIVWEMWNAICADLTTLNEENVDKVIAKVWECRQDDGFSEFRVLYGGEMHKTPIRLETFDIQMLREYIIQLEEDQLVASNVASKSDAPEELGFH